MASTGDGSGRRLPMRSSMQALARKALVISMELSKRLVSSPADMLARRRVHFSYCGCHARRRILTTICCDRPGAAFIVTDAGRKTHVGCFADLSSVTFMPFSSRDVHTRREVDCVGPICASGEPFSSALLSLLLLAAFLNSIRFHRRPCGVLVSQKRYRRR